MKKAIALVILALLLAASGCAAGADAATKKPVPTGGDSDIALPSGMEQVEFVCIEDSKGLLFPCKMENGDFKLIDVSSADVETLKEQSYAEYSNTFGEVENPREAADVAAIVVNEVYEKDPQEEAPYSICFNETADAWIVQGNLPKGSLGGVFIMAIGRQAGEIIMLQHGK